MQLGTTLARLMPFGYASNNAIAPEQTLFCFVISIIAGARRLAHTDWLRADKALHALLGFARFPGTDMVRNLLKRFTQLVIEAFWLPLRRWLLAQGWVLPPEGLSLDLDSKGFQRSGHQQGAERGYNPARLHRSELGRRSQASALDRQCLAVAKTNFAEVQSQ